MFGISHLGTTRSEPKAGVVMLTLMRAVVGLIMMAHGLQKLAGYSEWQANVETMGLPLPEVSAALALAGELAGGLGLLLGFITPIAAFGVACTMAVAILTVHISHGLFSKDGGFEYPLTLLVSALFFMLRGPGPYSLDALLGRSKQPKPLSEPARRSFERPIAQSSR
jgi:putative oxidoreductase